MKSGANLCLLRPRPRPRPRTLGSCILLVIGLAPGSLTAQPASAHVEPPAAQAGLGSALTFCIEATGSGPFAYQWQKNGVNLADQTNRCLALTNITIPDGGSYRATVFNVAGALASEEGLLAVALDSLPGGDAFGGGTSLTVASNSVQGESFSATRDPGEPRHFDLSTSNSVWYVWRAPASGIITFDTRGSSFDTVLAVYQGSYLGSLVEVGSDDDSGGFHTSTVSWNAEAGAEYRVAIDGVTGETGTYVCTWNLETNAGLLPVITLPPRSQTVPEGGTAVFRTAATNAQPGLSFQWFHNGQPLAAATSSNLTLVNVQTTNLGQYRLAVTNSAGRGLLSIPVDLEIGPRPDVQSKDKLAEVPPSAGGGGGAFLAAFSGGAAGTFSLAAGTTINQRFFSGGTSDRCEPAHCGVPGGASRWFQLAAIEDGVCTIDTQGSDVDTILAIYLQNFAICTNLYEPLVDCNNDALGGCDQVLGPPAARERSSRVSFFAPAGTVYRAVVDTVGGVRGTNVQFNVRFQPVLGVAAQAVQLSGATNCALQLRGSSLTLQVAPQLVSTGSLYQWQVNGRRIAGANRDRLLLPFLNYSDAGRYSVLIQTGTNRMLLPGFGVAVVDPCQGPISTGLLDTGVRLLGAAPEPIILEAAPALTTTSAWNVVGPILPSTEPTLWEVSTGATRFYRVLRSPP